MMRLLYPLLLLPGVMIAVDVQELLGKSVRAEAEMNSRRARYAYSERQTNYNGDSPESRTLRYDNVFVEGRLYRKLVERNGRPLSPKEQRAVDEDLARTARQRRAEARRKAPFWPGTRLFGIGDLNDLVELADFRLTEADVAIGDRRAFVLEAEAKPDLATRRPARRELACYRQRFWLDSTSFLILRREVEVVRPGAELLPGTTLVSDYSAHQAGEPWFETRREIRFRTKVFGVRTATGRQIHEYSGFRQFDVESTITFDPHF